RQPGVDPRGDRGGPEEERGGAARANGQRGGASSDGERARERGAFDEASPPRGGDRAGARVMAAPRSWTPGFVESFRLTWRPLAAYAAFAGLGTIAFVTVGLYYSRNERESFQIPFWMACALVGIFAGQLFGLLRARILLVMLAWGTWLVCMIVIMMNL